ncbi:hypothetical protein ACET3Z_002891 [Daucus carota]
MGNYTLPVLGFFFVLLCGGNEVHASHQYLQPEATREAIQPSRTSYHFQAPKNWLNDPNGPMYYKGIYHLFYQHNPYGAVFGKTIVWGHAISYDLINWVHLNNALYPSNAFDAKSCWSGSVTILPGQKPVILYTGLDIKNQQVQNMAMPKNLSDPFLREWKKYSHNPIMMRPDGVNKDDFRDPTTAWQGEDGKWRVLVGSLKSDRGLAVLYRSNDFKKWNMYDHPLYSEANTGIWECPDFYPISTNSREGVETSSRSPQYKYVLKASIKFRDYYTLGTYMPDVEKFTPETGFRNLRLDLRYDYGKFYASKTFFDSAKHRRILWGWINESDSSADDVKKGWSGIQSIPRAIYLSKNGRQLIQWPVEEIERLRRKHVGFKDKKLEGSSLVEIPGITASQADVEISFKLPNLKDAELMDTHSVDPQLLCSKKSAAVSSKVGPFGLLIFATKDLTEHTAVFFRIFRDRNRYVVLMCSDQSRSSLRKGVDKTTYGAFVDKDPRHEAISLRSLIDHSVIESFGGDGRVCITSRVYPTLAIDGEAHVYAFNNGSLDVVVSSLNAYSMNKASFVSNIGS